MLAQAVDIIIGVSIFLSSFACYVFLDKIDYYVDARFQQYPSVLYGRGELLKKQHHDVKDWIIQLNRLKSDVITFRENITNIDAHLERTGNQPLCEKSPPTVAEHNALIKNVELIRKHQDNLHKSHKEIFKL